MTIAEVLRQAEQDVRDVSSTSGLDAEVLLAFVLKKERDFFIGHANGEIAPLDEKQFRALICERKKGMPVAYLIGTKEFYGRDFFVNPTVLIPRPETELLIDAVCAFVRKHSITAPKILDIGTGSGCIAVTLKKKLPDAEIFATDISYDALAVAKKNAREHNVDIKFLHGDLFAALARKWRGRFDIIVSNPPYVNRAELEKIPETRGLDFEPAIALFPPSNDATSIIKNILAHATPWLAANRPHALFLEIGDAHGVGVLQYAKRFFPSAHITITKDYATHDRIVHVAITSL